MRPEVLYEGRYSALNTLIVTPETDHSISACTDDSYTYLQEAFAVHELPFHALVRGASSAIPVPLTQHKRTGHRPC